MTLSKSFFLLALAFVALCVAGGAATFALSGDQVSTRAVTVTAVALGVAVVILSQQAKRDLDAVLTLLGTPR
jgi:uncharacterized protein (UPF0333 family)